MKDLINKWKDQLEKSNYVGKSILGECIEELEQAYTAKIQEIDKDIEAFQEKRGLLVVEDKWAKSKDKTWSCIIRGMEKAKKIFTEGMTEGNAEGANNESTGETK